MRLAVPDLVSNSYFPAIAAVELGFMREEGLDVELDLLFPVTDAVAALRDGAVDFLAGSAHAPVYAEPGWQDVQLLAALARNMYWFLVVRPDLDVERTTLTQLANVRIGAAPGPDLGLRRLLAAEGLDLAAAGVTIEPVRGADAGNVSFGVTAAQALADGRIDAFWANGMGAEVAIRRGVGRVVVDARRDAGPASLFTFPALMATRRMIHDEPDAIAAAVRGIARAQSELRTDPQLATVVGRALFPAMEADLIAELVARDVDFYMPAISPEAVSGLVEFTRASGLTTDAAGYDDVVSPAAQKLWT
ncbi:MAG TPA: ABC transporter substrate-binding protein [Pseudonocardia sp.]|jgi:ABC-type nitrate/sulfonate/bicarbonate transport system substrate-binding protein